MILTLLTLTIAEECGPLGANAKCPGTECCSQYGWCGLTAAYCGAGCLSAFGTCTGTTPPTTTPPTTPPTSTPPVSTNGRCGNGFATSCPSSQCCSQYSYCGATTAYCGTGCQSGFGTCTGLTPTTPPTTPSGEERCGPDFQNRICANNKCCSAQQYCGTANDYCGPNCRSAFGKCGVAYEERCGASNGNKKCSFGCCNASGYCGSSYCGAGCQSAFSLSSCTGTTPPATTWTKQTVPATKCKNNKHVAWTFDDVFTY